MSRDSRPTTAKLTRGLRHGLQAAITA